MPLPWKKEGGGEQRRRPVKFIPFNSNDRCHRGCMSKANHQKASPMSPLLKRLPIGNMFLQQLIIIPMQRPPGSTKLCRR
ncbi:hypothetical protein SLA2020_502100 [Shorea laevis]